MQNIYKYPLQCQDLQKILMPFDAKILSVQLQMGKPVLWALIDPNALMVKVTIKTYGTGWNIKKDPGQYLGTYQMAAGSLIWHVFREPN